MNDLELALRGLVDQVADLVAGHADLEARIERMHRKGVVTDVDMTKFLYRQQIGIDDNGGVVKSPWIPYSQRAGGRKEHSPPSIGEQYLIINPDGSQDFSQGIGIPHGWYNQNPSPSSDPNADVVTRGSVTETTTTSSRTIVVGNATVQVEGDSVNVVVNGVQMVVTGAGVAITGGRVTHNGKNIGFDHEHTLVVSGFDLSGPPA